MTKRLNWWDFAHKKEPDIRLLERILHSDDCDLYNRDQIKAIRLISIHAPVRGYDRAHCPACGLIGSHAVPNIPLVIGSR